MIKTQLWFTQFKTESIDDIEIDTKGGFTLQIRYAEFGFPNLTKMIKSHTHLLGDIIKDNDLDILNLLFNDFSKQPNQQFYSINSLDFVTIESDIKFTGDAFLID